MARKILVVEDDHNISNLIQMYLEKEGFEIQAVFDGGAGCGRFSILLAKQGCEVTHFDISQPMLDKAAQLGATCGAAVKCRLGEDGIPVPERVTVSGALTGAQKEALSAYLEKELGLPREAQLYSNEGSP